MSFLDTLNAEDPATFRTTARRVDGRTAAFVSTKASESSATFGAAIRQLREAVSNAATHAAAQMTDLSEDGFNKRWRDFAGPIPAPYRATRDAGICRNRELDSWRNGLTSAEPVIPLDLSEGERLRLTFADQWRERHNEWAAQFELDGAMYEAFLNGNSGPQLPGTIQRALFPEIPQILEGDTVEEAIGKWSRMQWQ